MGVLAKVLGIGAGVGLMAVALRALAGGRGPAGGRTSPGDPAAATEARVRAALLAGGVDNFDLSVAPGGRTITVGAYRDAAQVTAALRPLQDAQGAIDGYAVRLAGPQGGGGGVMARMDAIKQLQQDLAAERAKTPVDAAKVTRLERALGELAAAELRDRGVTPPSAPAPVPTSVPAAAAHPAPLYPVGTQASWGGYTGNITQAWWDLNRWNYTVVVGPLPIVGTTELVRGEQELKEELASRLGQPKGPAYPKGLTVMRNGKGGLVEAAMLAGGVWQYQLKGWGSTITEPELQRLLAGA